MSLVHFILKLWDATNNTLYIINKVMLYNKQSAAKIELKVIIVKALFNITYFSSLIGAQISLQRN